jgi:hypothetical protein
LKQKANQYSGEPKFTSQSTSSFQSAGNNQLRHSWKSKPFGAQGQSFFWEPVNKDIPETGFTQLKNPPRSPANKQPHDQ